MQLCWKTSQPCLQNLMRVPAGALYHNVLQTGGHLLTTVNTTQLSVNVTDIIAGHTNYTVSVSASTDGPGESNHSEPVTKTTTICGKFHLHLVVIVPQFRSSDCRKHSQKVSGTVKSCHFCAESQKDPNRRAVTHQEGCTKAVRVE